MHSKTCYREKVSVFALYCRFCCECDLLSSIGAPKRSESLVLRYDGCDIRAVCVFSIARGAKSQVESRIGCYQVHAFHLLKGLPIINLLHHYFVTTFFQMFIYSVYTAIFESVASCSNKKFLFLVSISKVNFKVFLQFR